MRLPSVLIALALIGSACQSGRVDAPAKEAAPIAAPTGPAPAAPAAAPAAAQAYGASFEPAASVPLTTLLSNPQQYADKTVTTEGKVQRACTRKGCWMEIGEGDDACRVTFKDYGFFVPRDSAGAYARIPPDGQGTVDGLIAHDQQFSGGPAGGARRGAPATAAAEGDRVTRRRG